MSQLSGSDTPSDVWIGLWDIHDEGTFSWVNGENFGFFDNWAPGQPDGYLHFDNLPVNISRWYFLLNSPLEVCLRKHVSSVVDRVGDGARRTCPELTNLA